MKNNKRMALFCAIVTLAVASCLACAKSTDFGDGDAFADGAQKNETQLGGKSGIPRAHFMDYGTGFDSLGRLNSDVYYQNSDFYVSRGDPQAIYVSEEDDPVYGGYYYLYVSSEWDRPYGSYFVYANECYRSRDMVKWEKCGVFDGFALRSLPYDWTLRSFWAPEVYRHPEDGKYYMYYSAQCGSGNRFTDSTQEDYDQFYLAVAVSDAPVGPFELVRGGTDANGNEIKNEPIFNFKKHYQLDIPWGCIDPSLFRDTDGSLYLYFNKHVDTSGYPNGVWGMRLIDPVTPDWSTLTCLTIHSETSVANYPSGTITMPESGGEYGWEGLNEGPNLYKYGDRYYLSYSPFGLGMTSYSVRLAVSDSPLGPFVKPEMGKGNPMLAVDLEGPLYMGGTGHHGFLTAGDEIFSVYAHHGNPKVPEFKSTSIPRVVGIDRVMVTKINGEEMLVCNGPTMTPQYLPKAVSGYGNVAAMARVTATGGTGADYLNDGLLSVSDTLKDREYVSDGPVTITLDFPEPVTASSLLVYNSCDYKKAFSLIDEIRFLYAEPRTIDGKSYDMGVIRELLFPENCVNREEGWIYRGAAAIADFNEITLSRVEIDVSRSYSDESGMAPIGISDIVLLSRQAPAAGDRDEVNRDAANRDSENPDETSRNAASRSGTAYEIDDVSDVFDKEYTGVARADTDSSMVVDGSLDEEAWSGKSYFTTRFSDGAQEGGVSVSLTTHMTEKGMYIGADVKDPNIVNGGGNASPQTNSTLELDIMPDGMVTYERKIYMDAKKVVSPSNPNLPFCAYGVKVDGEVNSGKTRGMTMEFFIPWSSLDMETPSNPDEVTVLIYPTYTSVTENFMPNRYLRPIPGSKGNVSNYLRFSSSGYMDAAEDGALLGDSVYGTAKMGAWDLSELVSADPTDDVDVEDEDGILLSGTAKTVWGSEECIYLPKTSAQDFVMEATLVPLELTDAGVNSYGFIGFGMLMPGERTISFGFRYTNGRRELGKNEEGEINLRRLNLYKEYVEYRNDVTESEELYADANPCFDKQKGVLFRMEKTGSQFNLFADGSLLWSGEVEHTDVAGAPFLIVHGTQAQFKDISFESLRKPQ